jgi:hypothetical protein
MGRLQFDNDPDAARDSCGRAAGAHTSATGSCPIIAIANADNTAGDECSSDDACRYIVRYGSEFLAIRADATISGYGTTSSSAAAGDSAGAGGHSCGPVREAYGCSRFESRRCGYRAGEATTRARHCYQGWDRHRGWGCCRRSRWSFTS